MLNQAKRREFKIILKEDTHNRLKLQAVLERKTMKELTETAIEDFLNSRSERKFMIKDKEQTLEEILANAPYDDEPLTEEDKKAIQKARKDIKAGRITPFEDVVKELGV